LIQNKTENKIESNQFFDYFKLEKSNKTINLYESSEVYIICLHPYASTVASATSEIFNFHQFILLGFIIDITRVFFILPQQKF